MPVENVQIQLIDTPPLNTEYFEIFCELLEDEWPMLSISTAAGRNFERLKQRVFEQLEIVCAGSS
jgi:ribosome-interacting GTPase 1